MGTEPLDLLSVRYSRCGHRSRIWPWLVRFAPSLVPELGVCGMFSALTSAVCTSGIHHWPLKPHTPWPKSGISDMFRGSWDVCLHQETYTGDDAWWEETSKPTGSAVSYPEWVQTTTFLDLTGIQDLTGI